jgi:hypothetical protein
VALDVASPEILEEDQASPIQSPHDHQYTLKEDNIHDPEELIQVQETEIAPELTVLGEDTVADILLGLEQAEKSD